jgi:hypothetical protein
MASAISTHERSHQGLGNELIDGVRDQHPAGAFGAASASVAF